MKLENKRELAARALNVGKNRIIFNTQRLAEIKEAITKQDIRDLKESGAIFIREEKGRRKVKKRKTRRRAGSVKKKVKGSKRAYITITRKLRGHLATLKSQGRISSEQFTGLRKEIKAKNFRDLSHMKEKIILTKSGGVKNAKDTKKTKNRRKN
jgi:large subunit ribosomal protein L19e